MMDGFWLPLAVGAVLSLFGAGGIVLWYLITKRIDDSTASLNDVKELINSLGENFKTEISDLEDRLNTEHREVEQRFADTCKGFDSRITGQQMRLSEVSEAIALTQRDMYKDFMPASRIEAMHAELRASNKELITKVEGQLERLNEKIDKFIMAHMAKAA